MTTLLDRLDADFERLCAVVTCPYPGLPERLDAAAAAVRAAPDEHLPGLLRALRDGDELAGRVAFQAMMPAVGAAIRRGHAPEDAIGVLWELLATYPLERRPRAIAVNLTLDLRKRLAYERAAPGRERAAWAGTAVVASRPVCSEPSAAAVVAQARRLRLVEPATAEVLRSIYVEGLDGRTAAVRHGLSHAAVRQRCSASIRRLVQHREALLEAA